MNNTVLNLEQTATETKTADYVRTEPTVTYSESLWPSEETRMSTSVVKIIPALLTAQRNIKSSLTKDADNPFYSSKYATLESVIDACKSELNSANIFVCQPTGRDRNGDYVETQLWHTSGEFLTSRMYLFLGKKEDMQALGSAITYARRYTLQSMMLLAAVDDDGQAAVGKPMNSQEKKAVASRNGFKPQPSQQQDW